MNWHYILFLIVIILLVYLMVKNYWRVQVGFGGENLSINGYPEHPDSKYLQIESLGSVKAKTQKIVICTLVRDTSKMVEHLKKKVESIGSLFGDYRVLVVENDSSDNTRDKMLKWSNENPRVSVLGCGVNVPECKLNLPKTVGHSVSFNRIKKMCHLRNVCLDHAKKVYPDFDYLAMWDLDILGVLYNHGVLHSVGLFNLEPSIDAICAYGIYKWGSVGIYYDTYAHLECDEVFDLQKKYIDDLSKWVIHSKHKMNDPPSKVQSCFGGFTMYRMSSLNGVEYHDPDPENTECEHVILSRQLSNVVLNPGMVHLVLLNP